MCAKPAVPAFAPHLSLKQLLQSKSSQVLHFRSAGQREHATHAGDPALNPSQRWLARTPLLWTLSQHSLALAREAFENKGAEDVRKQKLRNHQETPKKHKCFPGR